MKTSPAYLGKDSGLITYLGSDECARLSSRGRTYFRSSLVYLPSGV